jgi:NAD(P)-dependent dehydrogenase (short-subunit alcohol dehydrogenase family)
LVQFVKFSNSVVLVAGGTGGLGRAVSLAFLHEGARVIVTYRASEELNALQAAAGDAQSQLDGHAVDATDEASVEQLIAGVINHHARLDVLVNTIGSYSGGTKLWEGNTKVFDQMLALNLRAGLVLCRAAVPRMLKKKSGAIVNIASKAAFEHTAGNSAYAASKAAALAMIDSLAEELKGTGVRANSVLPSIIDTEANRKAMPKAEFAKWPKPEDIARVILFLASDDAKVIHGAAIPVYGAN